MKGENEPIGGNLKTSAPYCIKLHTVLHTSLCEVAMVVQMAQDREVDCSAVPKIHNKPKVKCTT